MYLYPFVRTLWYSLINNTFQKKFVFLDNYIEVFQNEFFRLALRNTLMFSVVGVTLIVLISLLISFGLFRLSRRFAAVKYLLISPMILPTASIIFVWRLFFANDGYADLMNRGDLSEFWNILPIYLLYIWKNTGLNIIILTAAISSVPRSVHEAAALDGAGSFAIHRRITLPLITPSLVFVTVLSFVGTLKVFRESYLFFGTNYPPDIAYNVQFFMNNHFYKLNYQTLTTASVIMTLVVLVVVFVLYRGENRFNEKIY
jgi:multiple sugar transport system permease protein